MRATAVLLTGVITLAVLLPAAPAQADSIRDAEWHLSSLNLVDAQATNIYLSEWSTAAIIRSGTARLLRWCRYAGLGGPEYCLMILQRRL